MVAAPKAVYSAIFLATTMIALAMVYVAQDALFLGVVQVVVYTGAVMMLFLFVLMLIGVDSSESLVETIRGQRIAAIAGRSGLRDPVDRRDRHRGHDRVRRADGGECGRQCAGLAMLIFTRDLWAFELTSALLITAALGAMVLAHRERFERRKTQREMVVERFRTGAPRHPAAQPGGLRPAQRRRTPSPDCPTAREDESSVQHDHSTRRLHDERADGNER